MKANGAILREIRMHVGVVPLLHISLEDIVSRKSDNPMSSKKRRRLNVWWQPSAKPAATNSLAAIEESENQAINALRSS